MSPNTTLEDTRELRKVREDTPINSVICLKKIGSGMHRLMENSVREGVSNTYARKKVLEHHSGLLPSEKEHGTAFWHILSQKYPCL